MPEDPRESLYGEGVCPGEGRPPGEAELRALCLEQLHLLLLCVFSFCV